MESRLDARRAAAPLVRTAGCLALACWLSAPTCLADPPSSSQIMLKVRVVQRLSLDHGGPETDAEFSALPGIAGATTATIDAEGLFDALLALRGSSDFKILAEQDLLVTSGETVQFVAAGHPAVTAGAADEAMAAREAPLTSARIAFTPAVLSADRVLLGIAPSYNPLRSGRPPKGSREVRRDPAMAEVPLRGGQWLVVAGLFPAPPGRAGTSVLDKLAGVRPMFVKQEKTDVLVLISAEPIRTTPPRTVRRHEDITILGAHGFSR